MEISKQFIQMKSIKGTPVHSGDSVITPVSSVFALQAPFLDLVWNRPDKILVQNGDKESSIQIVNVTRLAQIAIYGFGATIMMILWLFSRKSSQ